MAKFEFHLVIAVAVCGSVYAAEDRTILRDLRRTEVTGVKAFFNAKPGSVERLIEERAGDRPVSAVPDHDVLGLFIGTITDLTLDGNTDEDVSTSGDALITFLPFQADSNGEISAFFMDAFTDENRQLITPYDTNYKTMETAIDSIERPQGENGPAILRSGDDVLELSFDLSCLKKAKDTAPIAGIELRYTDYPDQFDWGCDDYEFEFCDDLEQYEDELSDAGGRVCALSTIHRSKSCPTTVQIVQATGIFEDALSDFAGELPISSAADGMAFVHRRKTGLIFPCVV